MLVVFDVMWCYEWFGNVCELINCVWCVIVMVESWLLMLYDFGFDMFGEIELVMFE